MCVPVDEGQSFMQACVCFFIQRACNRNRNTCQIQKRHGENSQYSAYKTDNVVSAMIISTELSIRDRQRHIRIYQSIPSYTPYNTRNSDTRLPVFCSRVCINIYSIHPSSVSQSGIRWSFVLVHFLSDN